MATVNRWVIAAFIGTVFCAAHAQGADRNQPSMSRPSLTRDVPELVDGCSFTNLRLPEDFLVYAAGAYGGKELDIQIDQSGHEATEMQIFVNEPDKPVVLMLGAYEPTIWQLKWTPQTRILGVYVSGYHKPILVGLDSKVPVVVAEYGSGSRCSRFYVSEEKLYELNPIARKLFNQPVAKAYLTNNGVAYIGNRIDDSYYKQTKPQATASFRLPDTLLAGPAGLEEAVRQGILRPATPADFQAWIESNPVTSDVPALEGARASGNPRLSGFHMHNAYVILKPFRYPAGLYGANSATFILLKGVPRPTGNIGHSRLYDMNGGSCTGASCGMD